MGARGGGTSRAEPGGGPVGQQERAYGVGAAGGAWGSSWVCETGEAMRRARAESIGAREFEDFLIRGRIYVSD